MPDIVHRLTIDATPERVFEALTTAEGIRNWWTRDADLDVTIGGTGEFRFHAGGSIANVRVDALEPPCRIGWTTVSANAPGGWDGTTITFELRAEADRTVLLFAHRGFAEANDGYALVTAGWAHYLVSLRQYVETGRGAPHPHIDFLRVLH
jgi:uncharacterized protein YndB with AHSA1/START domain